MLKIGDLCASGGKYKDRDTGEEKTRWKNCGVLMQREDGSMVVKLESIPVGNWEGWLNVFSVDSAPKQQSPGPYRPPQRTEQHPAGARPATSPYSDDIPF